MSSDLQLPKEKEPEKKEIIHHETTETKYIQAPTEQKFSGTTDEAHAKALDNFISPQTKQAEAALTKVSRMFIVRSKGLIVAHEEPINQYRHCRELVKPIYPKFDMYSRLVQYWDLQSNGDGTRSAQLTQILSTPQMGFGMPPQQNNPYLEHLRRNYIQPEALGPPTMEQPKKKRLAWLRGGND